ncbi:TB2 DP1 HVA22 domain containing protein [Trichuris trichiura]|uniref:TB2 DP1 HVA22 domain containing protein n=1 Tax=Trichuris trichiura TaxID=36087 RepID=A0A077YZ08_TRITR|nr:TB2 DP1 HVA22 domain containing protein [Trichuris trichiura]
MSTKTAAGETNSRNLSKVGEFQGVQLEKKEIGFYQGLHEYVDQNDEFFGHFLDLIDDKWDIGRWPTFLVVVAVIVGILLAGDLSAKLLSFVLCCAYPIQRTQQLLLGFIDPEEDEYDYWLVFWVFYVIITASDYLFAATTGYWLIKSALVLYLYFPVTNGLELLIEPFLKPIIFIVAGNFDRKVLSKAHPSLMRFLHLDLIVQLDNDVIEMVQDIAKQPTGTKDGAEELRSPNSAELSKLIDQCKSIILDSEKKNKPVGPTTSAKIVAPPAAPKSLTSNRSVTTESLTPSSTPDMTPNITPNLTPNITPDMTPNVTPDMTPKVTPDVTPNVTPDLTPNVTPNITPNPSQSLEAGSRNSSSSKLTMSKLNAILKQLLNSGHSADQKNDTKAPVNMFQAMLEKQAEQNKQREAKTSDSSNVEDLLNRFLGSRGKQLQQEALETMRYLKNLERVKQLKKEKDDANKKADKET